MSDLEADRDHKRGDQGPSALTERLQQAECTIRRYLDHLGHRPLRWLLPDHPVRTKNLEKIAGHLQKILGMGVGDGDQRLACLLDQLERPERMAFDSAWEVTDLLELEMLRLADDTQLHVLLTAQAQSAPDDTHAWERHFPKAYLDALLGNYENGKFKDDYMRLEGRCALEYIQQARVAEFRVDRAKARLRGIYLIIMAVILAGLIAAMAYLYLTATGEAGRLLLAIVSGAAGSVLSRALKLGKQPLHVETETHAPEPPLGIRALLAGWKIFLAQPILGATAALIVFFVFSTGLLQLGGGQPLAPAGVALIGFLAGFSEPFFLGILDKVANKA